MYYRLYTFMHLLQEALVHKYIKFSCINVMWRVYDDWKFLKGHHAMKRFVSQEDIIDHKLARV